MRHNAKLLLVVLVLFVFNLKQWAQTPYRQYSNNGVELNFSTIDDVYFRAYLLYNLSQDDRFILTAEEDNGIFYIGSSDESLDEVFFDTFEDIYNLSYTDFHILSKLEITDLYPVWKSQVDPQFFTSMMMDITLRYSRYSRDGENETCLSANPFCTSDFYEFESSTSTETAYDLEPYPIEDGCIGASYNPSWYYLRIDHSGPLTIHMEGHDPDNPSTQRDIDFCLWGPFTEEQMNTGWACQHLTTDRIIDCNYSASYLENAFMGYPADQHQHSSGHGTVKYHEPQTGEYYLLMITNYSRQPCVITFNKPDETEPGTTDCSILPPIVNNDGPYCVGETIHLTAIGVAGASYSWTGPNNYRSRYQNPNRSNCTMAMAGPYICTITKNGQSACDTTWVEVYPQPNASFTASATNVCVGSPVDFNSTSTTNPAGYNISTYNWDFGDGQTGSGATQSHTFNQTGTYEVTLSIAGEDGDGHCTDEVTQTITVSAGEEINHDPVTSCTPYTWTEGNGETYSEPGVYNVVYETETGSGCPRIEYITITISDIEEDEVTVTECDSYTWADGDGQTYNTSGDHVWNTQTPEGCPKTVTLHLTINQSEEDEVTVTECDSYTWADGNGQTYTSSGNYTWNTQTAQGCDKTVTLHLTINQSEEDEVTVTECDSYTWADGNGQTYTSSGNYTWNTQTAQGCDKTVTLHLTINNSEEEDYTVTECDTYTWANNGQTYTTSGD